ncbi:MAG: methyltransferase [Bacteriovoracaceae bacterium]|nr:methyltransferase [Bacteriovoracaceae bacterium]
MVLENISDTALWVAVYRALESERKDSLFNDHLARKLAGTRGFEIVDKTPKAMSGSWAVVVRTVVFDEWIKNLIDQHKIDLVVNLAAGLDTRPYRLDLPSSLRWIEVDLPAIIEYKNSVLANYTPNCLLERKTCDLKNSEQRAQLFDELNSGRKRILVITEGLLVYLDTKDVIDLARDLSTRSSFIFWMTDLNSPSGIHAMNKKWGKDLQKAKSLMRFAPAEGATFFQPLGWKIELLKLNTIEGKRLKREAKFAWFWRSIGHLFSAEQRARLADPTKLVLFRKI